MTAKTIPKPNAIQLTKDELKEINRQVAWQVTWYILKRLLLVPVLAIVFVICVVIGVSTDQLGHALSGDHNERHEH